MRGKPVLAFGCASYLDFTGTYKINSTLDLESAIQKIVNNQSSLDRHTVKKYFNKLLANTVSCNDEKASSSAFNFYNSSNRIQGHIILLRKLLSGSFSSNN